MEFTEEEVEVIKKALLKLDWSQCHVGMARTNPKRVEVIALMQKVGLGAPPY